MARTRGAVLAVAFAYLVGSMLVLFHFALDRHAICLEHNTVHHVTVSHGAEEDAEAATTEQIKDYSSESDDHCSFISFANSTTLRVPKTLGDAKLIDPPLVRLGLRGTTDEIGQISRWRLAPKTSPPTV